MSQATMHVIFAILVITSGFVAVRSGNDDELDRFPQLHKCNRSQELPQLAKCLERSIESVQYYLKKNIITSLVGPYHKKDNYMFSKMRHFFGVLSLYDIKIQGLTNYNISNLWISPDFCQITFDALFPRLTVEAMYIMQANVMGINIATSPSRNKIEAELIDNTVTVIIDGAFDYRRDANDTIKEYFLVYNVEVNLDIASNNFFFNNIDKNRDVSEIINKRLNQNWLQFANTGIIDQLQHSVAAQIKSIAKTIFRSNSMNVLMPY